MAAAKKTTASKPEPEPKAAEPQDEAAPESVDDVHVRGGWDVGYVGDRVDETPNEAYSVAGVLKQAADGADD